MPLATGCRIDRQRSYSNECICSGCRGKDQGKGIYNAFGLQGLAFRLTSCYSSLQIPLYIGLGRQERGEPGFLPLVVHKWLAMLMRSRDLSDNVMILDRNVHMGAKVAALDDPPVVGSLQLTKVNRADWAQSYSHEVTQRVQTGVDQTR